MTTPPERPLASTRSDEHTMVRVVVPGRPAPQGSKRHIGHGRMIESSRHLAPWRQHIAIAAHNAMHHRALIDGAVTIRIQFVMPRPVGTPKSRTPPAVKRPDLDKLVRAVLDAASGTIWRDDSQIVEITATKRIADAAETPGAVIDIIEAGYV